jgi:polysaccharide biosynthesis transport protein
MANNHLPLSNDPVDCPSAALLPSNGAEHNGEWALSAVPSAPAGPTTTFDYTIYAHALRRHWLMALGIGLACMTLAGAGVWFGLGEEYTSSAIFRVAMDIDPVLRQEGATTDQQHFEVYKSYQMNQLLSRPVILKALDKPEIAKLVRDYEPDATGWLQGKLSVSFPGKAETMVLSLARPSGAEAQALVKAVSESYMTNVVEVENQRKRKRFEEVESSCDAKDREIREKQQTLRNLVGIGSGSLNPEVLSSREKLFMEELARQSNQLSALQIESGRVLGELNAQQVLLESMDKGNLGALSVDMDIRVQNDPLARQMGQLLSVMKQDAAMAEKAAKSGVKNPALERLRTELAAIKGEYDEREKELLDKALQMKRSQVRMEVIKLTEQSNSLQARERKLAGNIATMGKEANTFLTLSIDAQRLNTEIKDLQQVESTLVAERERLRVESKAAGRVSLPQPAEEPLMPSNTTTRTALTILAMLAAFCCPVALIAFIDTRTRRINQVSDVSQKLGLPVIGSVPLVPARVIRRLGSPSSRHRIWHLRLTESVDGIAARLLRKADLEQRRVIMVSSAAGGEGKTTLATQLAMSLARAGRRTVLVDFDLRRPAFDEVFGTPLAPGVSELLRRESAISELVHRDVADNLAVVTAGQWDRRSLASLSNGGATALFKQLREDFEFVVIDTSPILPVADARYVSQFADSVVLSVFRDVSESPKIQAACDILAAFGVRSIEAVVTGPNEHLYGRHMGYESTVTA